MYRMKCPHCQSEMQSGYIPNWSSPVQWLPNGKKPTLWSFSVAAGGVPLINKFRLGLTYMYRAKACYCGKCKIVIARTQEEPLKKLRTERRICDGVQC